MKASQHVNYDIIHHGQNKPIKAWIRGVQLEPEARQQLLNIASMPFIHEHIAVMPDAHMGKGTTVGSVIPTLGAIIPAAVGVDLGCGLMAVSTNLKASDLPDNIKPVRAAIETAVPVGFGYWKDRDLVPGHPAYKAIDKAWTKLAERFEKIHTKYPMIYGNGTHQVQLGSLGGGNHFIEVCIDQDENVWLMLHSGYRGIGNRIGTHFIDLARKDMQRQSINLPDRDLAYLTEGSTVFDDYVDAVHWAQDYAMANRQIMMDQVVSALQRMDGFPDFETGLSVINCHHNYVAREDHFGKTVWVTRKGAVRAQEGDWGIIPGSMGTGSFIVQGKGNPDSFNSCSHGAGRTMSRTKAKKHISVEQHIKDTNGVECRKDSGIIDESPRAYKSLDAVMSAQKDLVSIAHRLKPLVCVKG